MTKRLLGGLGAIGLLIVAAFLFFRPGFEEPGCACAPPPTLEEIQADISVVEKGDGMDAIRATGRVWNAYVARGDKAQAELWEKRAIAIGDPETIGHLVSDRMMSVHEAKSDQAKLKLLGEMLALLERGYPNRGNLTWPSNAIYVDQMRSARASLKVMQDGVDPWIQRAEEGDATAAHHLARYYFYVLLDQGRRDYWEKRAAELGDPELAEGAACCWRTTAADLRDGKRFIVTARRNQRAWDNIGDIWMQGVIAAELDRAENQIDRRLAASTGS